MHNVRLICVGSRHCWWARKTRCKRGEITVAPVIHLFLAIYRGHGPTLYTWWPQLFSALFHSPILPSLKRIVTALKINGWKMIFKSVVSFEECIALSYRTVLLFYEVFWVGFGCPCDSWQGVWKPATTITSLPSYHHIFKAWPNSCSPKWQDSLDGSPTVLLELNFHGSFYLPFNGMTTVTGLSTLPSALLVQYILPPLFFPSLLDLLGSGISS